MLTFEYDPEARPRGAPKRHRIWQEAIGEMILALAFLVQAWRAIVTAYELIQIIRGK